MKDQVVVDGLRIDQAKYGLGVYATRSFVAEETVGQVHGSVICDPDHSSEYCIALTDRVCLEPAAPFRFLNHSCEPNCILWQLEVEDDLGQRHVVDDLLAVLDGLHGHELAAAVLAGALLNQPWFESTLILFALAFFASQFVGTYLASVTPTRGQSSATGQREQAGLRA